MLLLLILDVAITISDIFFGALHHFYVKAFDLLQLFLCNIAYGNLKCCTAIVEPNKGGEHIRGGECPILLQSDGFFVVR